MRFAADVDDGVNGGPLLLDALSGHARAVAALMLHQQRRRWLSG